MATVKITVKSGNKEVEVTVGDVKYQTDKIELIKTVLNGDKD